MPILVGNSQSECNETMKNFPSMGEDYELWLLLAQTRQLMLKAWQKELNQYNISARHISVLHVIQAIGHRATPAEISRWLYSEPHSVSELLSRMEKQGLVRKVKDLEAKNQVRIVVTGKGREICYQVAELEIVRNMISSLSEEERQQLRLHLLKLRHKALKELGIQVEVPYRTLSQ